MAGSKQRGGRPPKPRDGGRAKGRDWLSPEKRKALRIWVDTQSIRETSRQTGVPIATLSRWLDDPKSASELERIGTSFARAIAVEDHAIARESTAGLRKGVQKCSILLDGNLDAKETAALTRALATTKIVSDRIERLNSGRETSIVWLAGDITVRRDELEAELAEVIRKDPDAAALLRKLIGKR